MRDINWFRSICETNGVSLSDEQADSLELYASLLLSWNKRVNLISRKDEDNFYPHHALNCVSFVFSKKLISDAAILDLGTGGGLPGIPLKILFPNLNLVLLDSIKKKTAALSDIVDHLHLDRTQVATGRAEDLAKSRDYKGKFDYVISRAAGKLDEIIKWSRGFLKDYKTLGEQIIPAGSLVVLKGGALEVELRVAGNLKIVDVIEVRDLLFEGRDEIENKEKKMVIVKYKPTERNS